MAEICADFGIVYYYNQEKKIRILKKLFPNIENDFMKKIQNVKWEGLWLEHYFGKKKWPWSEKLNSSL